MVSLCVSEGDLDGASGTHSRSTDVPPHNRAQARRARRAGRPTVDSAADSSPGACAGRRFPHSFPDGGPAAPRRSQPARPAAARLRRARASPRRAGRAAEGSSSHDLGTRGRAGSASPAAGAHAAGSGSAPLRAGVARGSGRIRVRRVASPAASRPHWHADGLVAGQAVVGLSVSQGPRSVGAARIQHIDEAG